MDFQEILDHADYNTTESKYKGPVKRYSSVLPPPKKVPKANVQSENVKRFLEKKKKEEEAKAAEAKRQREQLLALRAQNSKNSKKAKIMASRTKDNDFSRIKLTDDEVEAKKKREAELIRKNLLNKVERMKARIDMEEKEKLLPKKRKRKSKNGEHLESLDDHREDLREDLRNGYYREPIRDMKNCDKNRSEKNNNIRKPPRPPPPNLSFSELLKIAEKKQFEPVEVVAKKKEEEKLMTKKERKIMEEDLARQKRKQERLLQGENRNSSKPSNSAQTVTLNKKKISENKKPVVIHVEKDISKAMHDTSKFKIPKNAINVSNNKSVHAKHKDSISNASISKTKNPNSLSSEKPVKSSLINGQKKVKLQQDSSSSPKETDVRKKVAVPKKNGMKVNPVRAMDSKQSEPPRPTFDEEAFKASLEKQIREKMEKELEEKLTAKLAQFQNFQPPKAFEASKQVKKDSAVVNNVKKVVEKPMSRSRREDMEKAMAVKKKIMEERNMKPKLPEKTTFHKNPYLEPPRRLLEPQRPSRPPMKRRIESDDDDDDDDMSDFIDDGPSQNEEDYSKYIKEIFGYDRNRYVDDDDDEVMESSFAEQMKEEVRSARLGYLEDLEEEKLELERQKKKKKKK